MRRKTPPRRSSGFQDKDAEREALIAATPGLKARIAAHNIIADVIGAGHPLDERLNPLAANSRTAALEEREVALARSIATTAIRRFGAIRFVQYKLLERGLPKASGPLEWVLIAGLAQVLFMEVADHAAVDLAVRAVRLDARTAGFAGLVNGCLRNAQRSRDALLADCDPLNDETPAWLAQRWRKIWGEDVARKIASAHLLEPTLDVTVRGDQEEWADRLNAFILPTGSLRLRERTPVPDLPGFQEGQWWIQDAAAALPARLLQPRAGLRALDLCAAPGGKTAQLAAAGADVFAVDKSAERLKTLSGNLERLDLRADVSVADAATYDAPPFDLVLVDAPCTATGTIRRRPEVRWIRKSSDLESLCALQTRILNRAAALTKPGGRLVYAVCSIEPEEGEAQIAAFLRRNPDFQRSAVIAGEAGMAAEFITPLGEVRTLPSHWPNPDARLAGIDGFYAARLERRPL